MIIMALALAGCANRPNDGDVLSIRDISFDSNNDYENIVYIQEAESYEPYLVVSKDYKGGVLVLRQHLLDEDICYNDAGAEGALGGYYPDSNADSYLNSIFFSGLPSGTQKKILNTDIDVSAKESVAAGGGVKKTLNIERKIFLLSATELNIKSGMAVTEGSPLKYFQKIKSPAATTKNGEAKAQWLRSAYHREDIQAWSIGANGGYSGCAVLTGLAVRPAFCLDKNEKINAESNIVKGREVFVLQ